MNSSTHASRTFTPARSIVFTVIIAAAILVAAPAAIATDGTQLIGIGALQKGTGGAGVASPQDMTWVLLNPASIIDLGCRLDVNLELFAPYRTNEPGGLFGADRFGDMADDGVFLIPSLGYSKCCGCGNEAWGIGLYGVSGMGVNYDHPRSIWPGLFLKNYDRRTGYSVAKLAFGYAHTFGDNWSIGIAPSFDYARFKTDMLTLKFREAHNHDGWDNAYGVGLSLGIYKHWQRFGIGASYTSRQWMTKFKKYDDVFFESMDMPQYIQAGISYDITPMLTLVADYKWIDWSSVRQIGNEPLGGGFGWDDQHIIKLGATWYATPKWSFRAGFSHGNSPVDEKHVFANALFPAVTENHASVGFSYALSQKSEIHVTYMHAFENRIRDAGTGDLFSKIGRTSEISLRENSLTVEYSYKFQLGSCAAKRVQWRKDEYEKHKGKGRF